MINCFCERTDSNRLDLDALLDVSAVGVVGILVAENGLTAQGVDEGCPTYNATLLATEGMIRAVRVCS